MNKIKRERKKCLKRWKEFSRFNRNERKGNREIYSKGNQMLCNALKDLIEMYYNE